VFEKEKRNIWITELLFFVFPAGWIYFFRWQQWLWTSQSSFSKLSEN